jgi:hypothetical protein
MTKYTTMRELYEELRDRKVDSEPSLARMSILRRMARLDHINE